MLHPVSINHADIAGASPMTVKAIASFVLSHGGFATAVIEHCGRSSVRIVLIGEDGTWGDYVVPDYHSAEASCKAAKVDIADGWTRDLTEAMPYRA
jgi:hypothetical protein